MKQSKMKQPDIMLVMSDQHAAYYMGHEGGMVDTPCLDRLAYEGTRFSNHYTPCPLCVPARMSMMSGLLPTRAGVTANNHTLAETTPTFCFPLVEAGYETVLIGRMHFVGKDLRHGFMKRIGGDVTPTGWVPKRQEIAAERGTLMETYSGAGCLKVVGGGESSVRGYDEHIVAETLKYLSEPHDQPQFIVVGTFGPHFPYVAAPDLYMKYKNRGYLPETFGQTPDFVEENSWLKDHQHQVSREEAIKANAAYCALIEEADGNIEKIWNAFDAYTQKAGHSRIFGYLSDHGDMAGARNMYGKQTFFEDSARVPFLLWGDGIPANRIVSMNTSLLDVGPTVCSLAGTSYPAQFTDGIDLTPFLKGEQKEDDMRTVYSQFIESRGGTNMWLAKKPGYVPKPEEICYSIMVRNGKWKFVFYHDQPERPLLFDMENDRGEFVNAAEQFPKIAAALLEEALKVEEPKEAERAHKDRNTMNRWLREYERQTGDSIDERWKDNRDNVQGQLTVE